jgi:Rad3-related DNA helicase
MSGTVQMPTGTGKTITLLSLITSYQFAHPEVRDAGVSVTALRCSVLQEMQPWQLCGLMELIVSAAVRTGGKYFVTSGACRWAS